ncbi:MAG: asparaginase [Planctomycetes bacterium]|nr:asparaginase [Planctomycetota bacterium]
MKITVICTGGTIDKDYSCDLGGYNFEVGEPAVKRVLDRLRNVNFQYSVQSVVRKDSLDMTPEDRQAIARACRECEDDRILVTHGTDTMIETAAVLSGITDKTIVMTGAMRPEKFADSDAQFNFGLAVGALNVLPPGVYVAMSGRVYPWNKCRKDRGTEMFVETEA